MSNVFYDQLDELATRFSVQDNFVFTTLKNKLGIVLK